MVNTHVSIKLELSSRFLLFLACALVYNCYMNIKNLKVHLFPRLIWQFYSKATEGSELA